MSSMTPIRIRGKRGATKAEKWHYGKQRPAGRSRASSERSSSIPSTSSEAKSSGPARRTRRDPELSRLEELPTEVLQAIFEYSTNPDLALASPRIASQLASRHLYSELTFQILHLILRDRDSSATDLKNAMRLMNSRFFTWSFFNGWLRDEFQRLDLFTDWQDSVGDTSDTSMQPGRLEEWTWYRLRPHTGLLPPRKLLRAPFTEDKIRFLRFMTYSFRADPDHIDPIYRELAKEGLEQAIAEGAGETLPSFWTLGLQPDTELLRLAVIDCGCEKSVVRRLVTQATHLTSEPIDVDFLDPALWAWADKHEKGQWLIELLRKAARDSGRQDTEIPTVQRIDVK